LLERDSGRGNFIAKRQVTVTVLRRQNIIQFSNRIKIFIPYVCVTPTLAGTVENQSKSNKVPAGNISHTARHLSAGKSPLHSHNCQRGSKIARTSPRGKTNLEDSHKSQSISRCVTPLCVGSITKNLFITRTVKHNYISPISTVRIQLHVSVLYADHLQVEIFNLQIRCVGHLCGRGGRDFVVSIVGTVTLSC